VTQRLAIALTTVNLALLLLVWAKPAPTATPGVETVVRARALELVDEQGQVRAQLNVESNGEAVFRLRDARGTVRVKLGASEEGSGLLLLDDATEPGVHILAKSAGPTLTLRGKDGQQRVIKP
jgi:hypothetical protein